MSKNCVSRSKLKSALIRAGVPINKRAKIKSSRRSKRRYVDDYDEDEDIDEYISNITRCDARCRRENRRNELLRLTYVNAKENVVVAPAKRDTAEKNYYTTVFGQATYNEILNDKYEDEIKTITQDEKNNFNSQKNTTLLILENYDKNILLNNKLNELIERTLIDNNELIEKIDNLHSTINTNERKVYYNDQQINNLQKWKKYTLRILFLFYVLLLAIILIVKKNNVDYKLFAKFLILILIPLLLLPIITRVILTFYNFINDDAGNMGPAQLISKIILETTDQFKLFLGVFYAPAELLAL